MGICRINCLCPGAAAQAAVDCMVQQRLSAAALVYQQIGRQNIFPCTVEKRNLSPTVCAGQLKRPCFQQIGRCLFFRDSGIQKSQMDFLRYDFIQTIPIHGRKIVSYAGIPAFTVNQQQAAAAVEGNAVGIPAQTAVDRGSIWDGYLHQPLERPC